jgi:hypothetical protein
MRYVPENGQYHVLLHTTIHHDLLADEAIILPVLHIAHLLPLEVRALLQV